MAGGFASPGFTAFAARKMAVYSTTAAPSQKFVVEVDWNQDGAFSQALDDISADVIEWEYDTGRDNPSPLFGKAIAGQARIRLRNTTGTYSQFKVASPLYGLLRAGPMLRIRMERPGSAPLWTGWLADVTVAMGSTGYEAEIVAYGALAWLGGPSFIRGGNAGSGIYPMPVTTGFTQDAMYAVLDYVTWPWERRSILFHGTDMTTWYVAGVQAVSALVELADTAGPLFILFEDRDGRIVFAGIDDGSSYPPTVNRLLLDLTNFTETEGGKKYAYEGVKMLSSNDEIVNDVTISYRSFTSSALAVVWTEPAPDVLAAGASRTFIGYYPNDGTTITNPAYVAAWTTPVVGTDITQIGVANGDLSVVLNSARATRLIFTVTNNHATLTATLTLVQARGIPVGENPQGSYHSSDATSIAKYYQRPYPLTTWTPYYQAPGLVTEILKDFKNPNYKLEIHLAGRNVPKLEMMAELQINRLIYVRADNVLTPLGINSTNTDGEVPAHIGHIHGRFNVEDGLFEMDIQVANAINIAWTPAA